VLRGEGSQGVRLLAGAPNSDSGCLFSEETKAGRMDNVRAESEFGAPIFGAHVNAGTRMPDRSLGGGDVA
jgi:hypothetical protein